MQKGERQMKKMIVCMTLVLMLLCGMLGAGAESLEPAYCVPDFTIGAKEIPQTEAQAFADSLVMGFNLGNAFDANECNWLRNELDYESAWCGAKTSQALLDALWEAGFRTIRLPVSWHNHVAGKTDYTISEPWLNRVQQVVDWALERGFYVILNIHHDNNTNFLYPSSALLEQSVNYVNGIWSQLAARFADYDEHLIFESMNEPRLVGHKNEWYIDNGSKDCQDAIACINTLNQAFVDTVRASGSVNATRYLIVPGYDASPEGALNDGFALPADPNPANDTRILLGVHAYTPYSFALEYPGVRNWSIDVNTDKSNVGGFMQRLYERYVSKGQPVVITEFGARNKNGNTQARTEFTAYYVASARVRGMTCIWWDNNATTGNGELFGIIDRASCEWRFPSIAEAMRRYSVR